MVLVIFYNFPKYGGLGPIFLFGRFRPSSTVLNSLLGFSEKVVRVHKESAALKQPACMKITYVYEVCNQISPWECVVPSCPSFHTRYLYFPRRFSLLRKLFKDQDVSLL